MTDRPLGDAGVRVQTREVAPEALARLRAAGLPPLLARVLAARGIEQAAELDQDLAGLLPGTGMKGLETAARRLADAIDAREPILVVADYDCDGATACVTALRGLRMMGARVDYLVPNRFEHGYGLTPPIIDLACRHPRLGPPRLIVTVDNGIASHAGIARAHTLGIEVIVTDHHLPADTLPDALAIVDPNQPGCPHPGKHLAGVGVLFHVLLALRAELLARGRIASRQAVPLQNLLDLVALGTVADLVRLDRNNRLLVAAGLRRIASARGNPGIRALLACAGRDPRRVMAADLGFVVGPRVNAAGRLQDITVGIECLLADDEDRAQALAAELDTINRQRRELEEDMREQALADLGQPDPARLSLVVQRGTWHEGVIGLVASRLKELHHRPVIALAPASGEDGMLRGSGRSIPGVHLRDVLDLVSKRHPELIARFGGHAMAAGLSLRADGLARFEAALEDAVRASSDPAAFDAVLHTDGPLGAADLSLEVCDALEAVVWGQGFPAPLFCNEVRVLDQQLVAGKHLRLQLSLDGQRCEAMAFRRTEPLPDRARVACRLGRNEWRGQTRLQLIVEAVLEAPAPI